MDQLREGGSMSSVLDVFDTVEVGEPMSTAEVAAALGVSQGVAYQGLDAAVDAGLLDSKAPDPGDRIWWAPVPERSALGDERMLELVYGSKTLAAPFLEIFEAAGPDTEVIPSDTALQISVDSVVPLEDTVLQYYTAKGVSPSWYLEALRKLPEVSHARLLSTDENVLRVEVRLESDELTDLFHLFGGSVTRGELVDDEVRIVGQVPGPTNVRAVTEAVVDIVPDAQLLTQRVVYTPRLISDVLADGLSDQQRVCLEAAYSCGYFEIPRTSTGEEVAESLGITRQTFNHHLRHAEQTVIKHLFTPIPEDAL